MATEFELIDVISRSFPVPEGTAVGIGDDAAVLSEHFEVVTTDLLAEEIHFRFDWCEPEDVGWKAVTASLSDIAAMGARPGPYLASVAVGSERREGRVRGLIEGFRQRRAELPEDAQSTPIGGDLSASAGPAFVSITLFGRLEGDEPLLRSGAEVGDAIVLVGEPGRAAAGLDALESQSPIVGSVERAYDTLTETYRRPTAEVEAGRALGAEQIPSALIDVSDGLAADLGHIAGASGVGARVEVTRLPVASEIETWCDHTGGEPLEYAIKGGEDFCLLATVPPERVDDLADLSEDASWSYTVIGDIVEADLGFEFLDEDGEPVGFDTGGYEHFEGR